MNLVFISGRVGKVNYKHTPSGSSVLELSVATTEFFQNKNKEKESKTSWHRVNVWGKRADSLSNLAQVGDTVIISGKIDYSEAEKDGIKKYYTTIIANSVELIFSQKHQEEFSAVSPDPQGPVTNPLEKTYNISADTKYQSDDVPF